MADQKPRTITIELPADIAPDCYADLAHGVWMLLKLAGRAGDSAVLADFGDEGDTLATRWQTYEAEATWQ